MRKEWAITIDNFQGFAPGFWGTDFPFEGEAGHARDMVAVDLFYSNGLRQGPGISTLINGSQAEATTTLIKHILDFPVTSSVTYGIGGNVLYKITPTTVVDDATWPHTIDKGAVTGEDGESVCHYKDALFYAYNHSGGAGDIGRYDLSSTFDDDYMSTVPAGATTLQGSVAHQMIVGGDDIMYIANGQYIASFNGTTFVDQALDFLQGSVVTSIAWANNRLYAAVNKSTLTGNNKNLSSIYIWDTTSSSWEIEIPVNGRLGALFVKDGIVYIWWEELITDSSLYKMGNLDGVFVTELHVYAESSSSSSALPMFYQVTDFKNCVIWSKYENITLTLTYTTSVDDPLVTVDDTPETVDNYTADSNIGLLSYGTPSPSIQKKFFQCLKTKYINVGAVANPFGAIMVASKEGTNFDISKSSGYSTDARWETIYFHPADAARKPRIRRVVVFTEPLLSGARIDSTLWYDFGKGSIALDKIMNTVDNKTKHIIYADGVDVENFALDFYWTNGSTVNPVYIRKIEIEGEFIHDS